MNPNYIHTITLYHKEEDGSFTRTVLRDCFWKSQIVVNQTGTQASQSNIYTVRIPLDAVPQKKRKTFSVKVGDIIVHGSCQDEITEEKGSRATELLLKYKPEAFKVTAFSDNTAHRVDKHYRVGG